MHTTHPSPKIGRWANVLLVYGALRLFSLLLLFKQTEYNLVSPWLEEGIPCEVFSHYVDRGLIIGVLFMAMLLLKIYQKNAWVLGLGILLAVGNEVLGLLGLP